MTNADHLLSRRRFLTATSLGTATAYGLTSGRVTTAHAATSADVDLTTQPTDHVIYNPSLGNGIMDGFPPPKEKLVTRDNWAEDPVKRTMGLTPHARVVSNSTDTARERPCSRAASQSDRYIRMVGTGWTRR